MKYDIMNAATKSKTPDFLNRQLKMRVRQALRENEQNSRGLDDLALITAYSDLPNRDETIAQCLTEALNAHVETPKETKQEAPKPKPAKQEKKKVSFSPAPYEPKKENAPVQQQHDNSDKTQQLENALIALQSALQVPAPQFDEQQLIALIKEHTTITRQVTITPPPTGEVKTLTGTHKQLPYILDIVSSWRGDGTRQNAWLYGPSGTGKTTLAYHVADALSLDFYSSGAVLTPYELVGNLDAHGNYSEPSIYKAFKCGGVMLIDEIDGCSARALICINQLLANKKYTFPNGETVERHQNCVIIAGSNTLGKGATMDYVGRAEIDEATRDRFIFIECDYDNEIETNIANNVYTLNGGDNQQKLELWITVFFDMRKNAAQHELGVLISTRLLEKGAQLLAKNYRIETLPKLLLPTLNDDQLQLLVR